MNGKERLIWAENAQGYAYLTTFDSPLKPGFQRFSTTTPSEMDRVYAKLSAQETARYENMTQKIFAGRKEFLEQTLSDLRTRMANSKSAMERDFLRAWIEATNNRMSKLMSTTVYGLAEIQKTEAPRPVERPLVTVEEIREMKPETQAVQ